MVSCVFDYVRHKVIDCPKFVFARSILRSNEWDLFRSMSGVWLRVRNMFIGLYNCSQNSLKHLKEPSNLLFSLFSFSCFINLFGSHARSWKTCIERWKQSRRTYVFRAGGRRRKDIQSSRRYHRRGWQSIDIGICVRPYAVLTRQWWWMINTDQAAMFCEGKAWLQRDAHKWKLGTRVHSLILWGRE